MYERPDTRLNGRGHVDSASLSLLRLHSPSTDPPPFPAVGLASADPLTGKLRFLTTTPTKARAEIELTKLHNAD